MFHTYTLPQKDYNIDLRDTLEEYLVDITHQIAMAQDLSSQILSPCYPIHIHMR